MMMVPYLDRPDNGIADKDPDVIELEGGPGSLPLLREPPELREDTPRWHFDHEGRRFILYDHDQYNAAKRAETFAGTPVFVVPSGHFCHTTNMIVGAQDGDVSFVDARPSGGGSRG